MESDISVPFDPSHKAIKGVHTITTLSVPKAKSSSLVHQNFAWHDFPFIHFT